MKKNIKSIIFNKRSLSLLLLCFLILLYSKSIWCHDKILIFSDIDFGLNDTTYIHRMMGVFNQYFSSMNFFNMSRLVIITPLYFLVNLTGQVTSGYLLKSLLVVIFITSGIGMYQLCEKILLRHFTLNHSLFSYVGLVIPSLFYTINPWVFMRIQHVFLLAGYAMFPWVLYFFFDIFDIREEAWNNEKKSIRLFKCQFNVRTYLTDDVKSAFYIAICVAIGSAAIHYFFFIILTMLLLSVAILIKCMRQSNQKMTIVMIYIKKNLLLYTLIFIMCAYWIIPYFVALLSANIEPNNVNVVDTLGMFSRNSNFVNILYLISYWWPMFNKDVFLDTGFYIGGGIYLLLITIIVFYRYKWHFYIRVFSMSMLLLVLFSTGLNLKIMDEVYITVVTRVPIIGHVFRDPNKIIGPMIAFMSVLISFAIDRYLFTIRREGFSKGISLAFLLILFSLHYMYIRPFDLIFSEYFYSGSEVPKAYQDINNHLDINNGKVLWMPSMDNMVLSNGTANYKWNVPADERVKKLNLQRLAGDFHFYSSLKPSIFQHENNDGMVSYMYTFMQYLLDCTGAQHFGTLVGWLGFNEVAIHNDVYKQEQRQQFNQDVLKAQTDLKLKYQDDIFSVYNTPTNFNKAHGTQNSILHTKGLFSFMYMMDYAEDLEVSPQDTAVLWNQAKKADYQLSEDDLTLGSNYWDIYLPFVDEKFYIYPFDVINTGNPHIGWAKTMTKEGEWLWLMKANNIKNFDFEQDFSHGVAYTYVSHKLSVPYYKLKQQDKTTLIAIDDVLNNFFVPDNDSIFNMTVFPEVVTGKEVLQGSIKRGLPGMNNWQVAKSKLMDVQTLQGGYINISAVVSGVNAGTINFKIRLYDEHNKEIGVSYLSNPNNSSEYVKTEMDSLVYVPVNAKNMRIDILSSQDVNRDIYFWIHDFKINNITSIVTENVLELDFKEKSPSNQYKLFMRSFNAYNSSDVRLTTDSDEKIVSCRNIKNKFQWSDLGTIKSNDGHMKIYPSEGYNVLNAFIAIPIEQYEAQMNAARTHISGQQADLSLVQSDWDVQTPLVLEAVNDEYIFANTISGSMAILNGGTLTKQVDIIKKDNYVFHFTGNLIKPDMANLEIYKEGQLIANKKFTKNAKPLNRNFEKTYFALQDKKDQYFLKKEQNIDDSWTLEKYSSEPFHLSSGQYTFVVRIAESTVNSLKQETLHFIEPEEVVVPEVLIDKDMALQSMLIPDIMTSLEKTAQGVILNNKKSESKLWIIGGLNKTFVKKGQRIVFKSQLDAKGVKEVHGKLLWVDENNKLLTTNYVPYNVDTHTLYFMTEAQSDGYVLPCIFYQSDPLRDGTLKIESGSLTTLGAYSKLEGTALLPEKRTAKKSKALLGENGEKFLGAGVGYLIQNEAYNIYWKFNDGNIKNPELVNFIHNGYQMNKAQFEGTFELDSKLRKSFSGGLLMSMGSCMFIGMMLWKRKKRSR